MCYLPYQAVTVSYTPNTGTFDCQSKLGQGYYIVPNSASYSADWSNLPHEKDWCAWQPGGITTTGTKYDNGLDYAISTMQNWNSVGCEYGSCCSWVQNKPAIISTISCTNDTAIFTSN